MTVPEAVKALRRFKDEIPTLVGNELVNFALDNLHAERTVDGTPMEPRKAGAPRDAGRRLLMDKGDGERSIEHRTGDGFVEATANDYMVMHNQGGSFSVRAHTRTRNGKSYSVKAFTRRVPSRTFLAPHPVLEQRIISGLQNRYNKLIR